MPFNEDGSRKAGYKRTGFKMKGFSAFDRAEGNPDIERAINKVKREISAANGSSYASQEAKEKDLAQLNNKLAGLQARLN